jgi:predicted kinase
MMIGLPRSGKTTAARELGHPIVSPDSIRLALHGHVWREEAEPMVWAIARIMVESLFGAGHTQVTLDACNHNEKRRMPWQTGRWGVVFHLVTTDVETCLQRAREGGRQDLLPVIERMARDWEPLGGKTDC